MQDGSTALHLAALMGHIDIVKMVIEQGAHIDIPDNVRIKCLVFVDVLHFDRRNDELTLRVLTEFNRKFIRGRVV